ncbi:response regulator transcription factor, partial [Pseudomonas aeruginosa]|nr:response regulator transcription factor [Pseudomonas aeruginosa]
VDTVVGVSEATGTIRVLVVDDDPLVRSALSLMLGGQPDLVLVGEAGNGVEAIEMVERERPRVVLMDIRMPVMNGLEATKALVELAEPPSVIVLTTFHADEHVVAAVAAGADGFLLKDTPPHEIVSAVRRVADGEAMLSPAVTRT